MKYLKAASFIALILVALALGNGCNLAPQYHKPTTPTPVAYKETNGWKMAQPSDGVLKGNWWELFHDPELNALEVQVAISNQNLQAAVENFFASRAVVQQARAAYYPTLGVSPAVNYSHSSATTIGSSASTNTFGGSGVSSSRNFTLLSLPADASWELDLWDAVRNTVRSDTYSAQSTAALIENTKLTAQADLAVDYFSLRAQDDLIKLFDDTVVAFSNSLQLTTTLYETGIYSALNETQANALLQTTLAQATALGIQRAQFEHAIAVLIGQPASTFSIKQHPITNTPPEIPIGLPSALLERRPDIASAERIAAAANASIGVTRAAFFPSLNLSATGGYESTSLASLVSPPSFFWSLGASLSETVFDAGRRKAATEQAWANYRAQVANYRETVLAAFQQVEDNLAGLRILSTETKQQDVAIRANQRNLDLSMEQFRQGVASYLNVITAQESLLSVQQTQVTLKMQQLVDTVQLIMALGGGWSTADLPASGKLALKPSP